MKERFINIVNSLSEKDIKELILELFDRDLDSSLSDEAYFKIYELCKEIENEL